jgi:hypothetical protein
MEAYRLTKEEGEKFDFDVDYSDTKWQYEGDTYTLWYYPEEFFFRFEKAGKEEYDFFIYGLDELKNILKIMNLTDD